MSEFNIKQIMGDTETVHVNITVFLGNKTRVYSFNPEDGDISIFVSGNNLKCNVIQQPELDFDFNHKSNLLVDIF